MNTIAPAGTPESCANCQAPLHGPWCSQCGQKRPSGRLTLGSLGRDFMTRVVDIEAGLMRTLGGLIRNPRPTIQGWLDGRRKHYLHPFALLLVTATLSVLMLQLFGESFTTEFRATMAQMSGLRNEVARERFADFWEMSYSLMPYWMLFFVLPVAALLRVLFPKRGYSTAEYWAACIYAIGLGILVDLPLSAATGIGNVPMALQIMITNLVLVLTQVYVLGRFLAAGWTGWLRVSLATLAGYFLAGLSQQMAAHFYAHA